jgi:predicted DNA-binding transcriptional regulator AlpA
MATHVSKTTTPSSLPSTGFLRLPQVLRLIPVSKTTWWNGVREGSYPKPVRLGARSVGWRAEDIGRLIAALSSDQSVAA